jgi:hypothetical protein
MTDNPTSDQRRNDNAVERTHDAQEEIYEILLKEVETLCEGGVPASDIAHALIRNAVELAVVCTLSPAEAREMLAEATRGTLLDRP